MRTTIKTNFRREKIGEKEVWCPIYVMRGRTHTYYSVVATPLLALVSL